MLAAGEAGLTEVGEALSEAVVSIQQIGELGVEATDRLHDSDAAKKGFAGRLLVTRQLSSDLAEPVAKFEAEIERYYEALTAADAMTRYVLSRLKEDSADETEIVAYLDNVDALIDAAEGSESGIASYTRSAADWKRLSKDLSAPAKTIERAGHRMLEGIAMISAWRDLVNDVRGALDD